MTDPVIIAGRIFLYEQVLNALTQDILESDGWTDHELETTTSVLQRIADQLNFDLTQEQIQMAHQDTDTTTETQGLRRAQVLRWASRVGMQEGCVLLNPGALTVRPSRRREGFYDVHADLMVTHKDFKQTSPVSFTTRVAPPGYEGPTWDAHHYINLRSEPIPSATVTLVEQVITQQAQIITGIDPGAKDRLMGAWHEILGAL